MNHLDFSAPTPLEYFAALVQNDDELPLLEAAVSIAQDEYPELDIQQVLSDVDQLHARIRRRLAADASHVQKLRILNQFFFRELSFGGNVNHYYDPDNSYVHAVLRTRRGIPITLALIWLELAQSLGLPATGVSFPGHFMIKVSLAKGQVVIDPFTGQSLSREELSERLQPFQRSKDADGGDAELPLALFLRNAAPRDILMRMLGNLREIHQSQNDWPRLAAVLDRMVILQPEHWPIYRDRGLARAEMGDYQQAQEDLERYMLNESHAADAQEMAIRLESLRRMNQG